MDANEKTYRIYKDLAEREGERGADQLRDRFLILAADAALMAGKPDEAEQLRERLLATNPSHLLKPYESMAEAVRAAEVASYLADLRRGYPPEEAERLLQSLHGGPMEEPAAPPPPQEERELYGTLAMAPSPAMPEAAPPLIPPPYRPEPAPPARAAEEENEDYSGLSYYLCSGLFVILLVAVLALAGHVLVRPFVVM